MLCLPKDTAVLEAGDTHLTGRRKVRDTSTDELVAVLEEAAGLQRLQILAIGGDFTDRLQSKESLREIIDGNPRVFNALRSTIRNGTRIVIKEGNHDFLLNGVGLGGIPYLIPGIQIAVKEIRFRVAGRTYRVKHGDEFDKYWSSWHWKKYARLVVRASGWLERMGWTDVDDWASGHMHSENLGTERCAMQWAAGNLRDDETLVYQHTHRPGFQGDNIVNGGSFVDGQATCVAVRTTGVVEIIEV